MFEYISYFCLAFFISSVLTPLVRCFAKSCFIFDEPNKRKVHVEPVPRLGGTAIAVSFLVCLVVSFLFDGQTSTLFSPLSEGDPVKVVHSHPFGSRFFAGALIIFLLGLYDDWKGTNARVKFFWQIVASCLVVVGQAKFGILQSLGFQGTVYTVADTGLSVFWITYVCNAFNLIDGLDGLCAGTTFFACIGLFGISLTIGKSALALLLCLLAGAVLAFLQYNRHPAKIFMGDSGSLFVGFCLSIFCLDILASGLMTGFPFVVPLLALALPLCDTTWAIIRRYLSGKGLFSADKGHIHHKFMEKTSHRGAVNRLYAINFSMAIIVCLLSIFSRELGIWGHIIAYGLIVFGWYLLMTWLNEPQMKAEGTADNGPDLNNYRSGIHCSCGKTINKGAPLHGTAAERAKRT